ncbi:hypothetical protein QQF64_016728 [Cirrhinus molitorella]|uniref:Uncharacterized protein n=1 Tax=Cirrhinus molitorella TaxID=172907 RepID=A0ABR3LRV5_9TELE
MGNPGSALHPFSMCDLFGRTPEALSDVSRQKLTKGPGGTSGKRMAAKDSGHERPLWGEEDNKGEKNGYTSHLHRFGAGHTRLIEDVKLLLTHKMGRVFYSFPKIHVPTRGKTVAECVNVCVSDRNSEILKAAEPTRMLKE